MHPRRVLPQRRELSTEEREVLLNSLRARKERVVTPEETAASLAKHEAFIASVNLRSVARATEKSFKHLGVFGPSEH